MQKIETYHTVMLTRNGFPSSKKNFKEGLAYRDTANTATKPVQALNVSSVQKFLNLRVAYTCDLFCLMCACSSYRAGCPLIQWCEGHL